MKSVHWLQDGLPSFLWVAHHIVAEEDRYDGISRVLGMLRHCDEWLDIDHAAEAEGRAFLDGTLQSFDTLSKDQQQQLLDAMIDFGGYGDVIREEFAHALGMYPTAPGAWLLRPWQEEGLSIDPSKAERTLADLIDKCSHGQSDHSTACKVVYFARQLEFRRLRLPPSATWLADELSQYPKQGDDDFNRMCEATIRAMFGGIWGASQEQGERLEWAKRFWRSNGALYVCRRLERTPEADLVDPEEARQTFREALDTFRADYDALNGRFRHRADTTDPDIYSPARYEVLCGLTNRALRLSRALCSSPTLWESDYGLPLVRSILESLILIRWMAKKEGDEPLIYDAFQEHGRGSLKLYKLHLEEVVEKQEDPPEEMVKHLDAISAEVAQDVQEEFQNIYLHAFGKTNIRKMAADVGMKEQYDLVYSMASATAHGEWHSLDRYALTRCTNPLHRWHRIVGDTDGMWSMQIVDMALQMTEDMVEEFETAMPVSIAPAT
jgi:hypothetical protein